MPPRLRVLPPPYLSLGRSAGGRRSPRSSPGSQARSGCGLERSLVAAGCAPRGGSSWGRRGAAPLPPIGPTIATTLWFIEEVALLRINVATLLAPPPGTSGSERLPLMLHRRCLWKGWHCRCNISAVFRPCGPRRGRTASCSLPMATVVAACGIHAARNRPSAVCGGRYAAVTSALRPCSAMAAGDPNVICDSVPYSLRLRRL